MSVRIMLRCLASLALAVFATACGGGGTAPRTPEPEPEPPVAKTVWRSVSLGMNHACGLTADGSAYCWGLNGSGELGVGTTGGVAFSPVRVSTNLKFQALAVGASHTCALTAAGETFCWGQSNVGFLNDRTSMPRTVPTRVVGVPAFKAIAAGTSTCGLADSGEITCWQETLIPVPPGLPAFQNLAMSWTTYCGLTSTGEAHCWGSNNNGQLGSLDAQAPVVIGDGMRFRSLAVGKDHMCGVTVLGVTHCWGLNQKGQLGLGTTSLTERVSPVATSLSFDAVFVSAQTSCGLVGRTAFCWAYNHFGQVGDGTRIDRLTPVPVVDGHDFMLLDVGDFAPDADRLPSVTCGVTVGGAVYCWGYSTHGQLGAGPPIIESNRPVRLAEPTPLN